jgi:hypothetical protein
MPAFAYPHQLGAGDEHDLEQARESLDYWEDRARRLPLHAVRGRREAREMAARWRDRVTAAEQAAYGRGLLGLVLLVAAERRLPEATRARGRTLARRGMQLATVVFVAVVTLVVAGLVAAVEILAAILDALT